MEMLALLKLGMVAAVSLPFCVGVIRLALKVVG